VTRPYDPAARRAAHRITQRNPGWLVLWGAWSREFWAFPTFHVPPGTLVHAPTPAGLLALMEKTELATRNPPGPFTH
jgi:hypothetical protein